MSKIQKIIMRDIAKELVDARGIEKKNSARMPRLEGYIEALEFCLGKAKFANEGVEE